MKVHFFASIDTLVNRVGSRFKNRLQRLCAAYRKRHPSLCSEYLKFAVSVGWSFLLAAQGGDIGYAQELTHGLDGNYQSAVNTGLNEMHLMMSEDDFEYVRDMTFDIALLLFEEMTPTPANQVFYDYLGKRENYAYKKEVLGDEPEPAALLGPIEAMPEEEKQALVKKYQALIFEKVQSRVLAQCTHSYRMCALKEADNVLKGTGWTKGEWSEETERMINEMGCATSVQPAQSLEVAGEIFHFIHPSVTDDMEKLKIHKEVENLVCNNTIPNICAYLNEMAAAKRILQPVEPKIAIKELRRMGMPEEDTQGFSEKNFQKYYRK